MHGHATGTKTLTRAPATEEPARNPPGQGKRAEIGQFRLQVDRKQRRHT